MNKIDFGNVFMQSPTAQSEHKALSTKINSKQNKKADNFQSVFKNVGTNEYVAKTNSNREKLNDSSGEVVIKGKETELAMVGYDINPINSLSSIEQLIEEFGLMSLLGEKVDLGEIDTSELLAFSNIDMDVTNVNQEQLIDEDLQSELMIQLNFVLQQLASLMNKGEQGENLTQVTKEVHKLLQLWGRLPQQLQQSLKENEFMLEDLEEESEVLRELLNLFEKRNAFAKQQMYQTDSTITHEDIENWLQQALSKHSFINAERTYVNVETNQTQPLQMGATQQYTLHVTESERVDAISRNLVSDLSNIVRRSNFLKQPGLEELTLTLRPQSLGDVTIRLSQINGEMTVRFLVATQAARELFESNLHQLKPMFAPNNVVIERDAGISDEDFYQEEQEQFEEEEQKEKDQQSNHDDTSQADVSFDELLQFLSEEANI